MLMCRVRILTPGGGGYGSPASSTPEVGLKEAVAIKEIEALPIVRDGGSLADWKARSESS